MKDNLLFWLDNGLLHFGLAHKLQEKFNGNYYAIINDNENFREFYSNQKFVDFKKMWFFHDHISTHEKKPDFQYLKGFEEKYGINLWLIASTEKVFYKKYNQYYHFTGNEILCILEKECKFFEKLIDDIKPNFLFISTISRHSALLLYLLCKSKNVEIFTLESPRLASKWAISNELNKIPDMRKHSSSLTKQKTFEELENYLKQTSLYKHGYEYKKPKKISKWEKIKGAIQFPFLQSSKQNIHFTEYGKTKLGVILHGKAFPFLIKRKIIENFIDRNFDSEINTELPFVYFPLHAEPERRVLMDAPFYSDQINVISSISKSLPTGYLLFVKEHPLMRTWGWRSKDYYKKIMDLPNVKLIHPSITNFELIKKSSLVITIVGTGSLEAAFYGKPSIVFADVEYSQLPSVSRVRNLEDLPKIIRESLEKKVDPSEINDYIDLIEKSSLQYNNAEYGIDFSNRFYYVGYLKQKEIIPSEVKSFLDDHKDLFELLAVGHLEKMNQSKIKK